MQQDKFNAMVREFPFLTEVFTQAELKATDISGITVARGDRNLLEVTPAAWCHDAEAYGEVSGYRSFWFVTEQNEVSGMNSAWCRTVIPHGVRSQQPAQKIGVQLASSNKVAEFIVEIGGEAWDNEDLFPSVTIYKMRNINFSLSIDRAEKELYTRRGYPAHILE